MSNDRFITRRDALKHTALLTFVGVGAGSLLTSACDKKASTAALSCNDTSSLAPADLEMRTVTMAYVEKTADPAKACENCQQYKAAPAPGSCGGCTILKGPINPAGFCKAWIAKQPS